MNCFSINRSIIKFFFKPPWKGTQEYAAPPPVFSAGRLREYHYTNSYIMAQWFQSLVAN